MSYVWFFLGNVTELNATVYKRSSKAVLIRWKQFSHYDSRTLLGYVVYTIEAPYRNVTMYDGRDACGGDGWVRSNTTLLNESLDVRLKEIGETSLMACELHLSTYGFIL